MFKVFFLAFVFLLFLGFSATFPQPPANSSSCFVISRNYSLNSAFCSPRGCRLLFLRSRESDIAPTISLQFESFRFKPSLSLRANRFSTYFLSSLSFSPSRPLSGVEPKSKNSNKDVLKDEVSGKMTKIVHFQRGKRRDSTWPTIFQTLSRQFVLRQPCRS